MAEFKIIGVLGLGHVGLPTAVGFAELGYQVIGTDSDAKKVETIAQGKSPFYEPELEPLLQKNLAAGRLRVTNDVGEAVRASDILFVCVGTPQRPDGSADLSQVEAVIRTVAENLNGYKLIVEKSTVPVQTAQWIKRTLIRYAGSNATFDVASNPEFLREGTAVHDFFHPDRIVIGVESERAKEWLLELYRPLNAPIVVTDLNTAEIIKHAANSFLALKISFINMVADLCEATGADVVKVAEGIGLDPRIGKHFLQAGLGFGGYCLPKDLKAFIHIAEEHNVDFSLLKEVERINEARVDRFVRKVQKALWVLKDKTLAIWGLAFKPNTDDIREAPSLKIIRRLLDEGANLRLYDPAAMENVRQVFPEEHPRLVYCQSALEAATGAHAILLVTEWDEFKQVDWHQVKQVVALPIVVDGRNCLDPTKLQEAGFEYYGMGRPSIVPAQVVSVSSK
ncbi:UDP-glucose/GDP-mannose dehydrogenase family protein [Fervidibacter sacchari]|uniref:UDP-glucose 6-dehydrogenase n=1 Tax=Candidatus Fervidibacter sacchari TaxID=1448929 RepID=A0ABT2ELT0_9BACT|nr:UDP-glucose/GDP-mannose dehydrogenase family protein [Candidatus Fervidibacter sacchari]MCS3918908.1 UDPglucose 6-dehydrogenase [Candidatus Fervidibacter sacchari]WKU17351.1 UDP-glucose/GDP-mannose dehydrogenase family protein [Candidatus Fervidibacter sacchari]